MSKTMIELNGEAVGSECLLSLCKLLIAFAHSSKVKSPSHWLASALSRKGSPLDSKTVQKLCFLDLFVWIDKCFYGSWFLPLGLI